MIFGDNVSFFLLLIKHPWVEGKFFLLYNFLYLIVTTFNVGID